ncbi:lipoate--protein ligase family protein [Marinicrinis sediminis]|uniref:Biotin/lipoate A/B protein ligase family protein n=1 Tax=Marinicrinis sediminis TaxID=1652465 RepID=A0ABW5R900_9BACL
MEKEWRFIDTGAQSPAMNMAIDEAILTAHAEGKVPPTLRFYGWNPATLSIGYFQKAEEEVDFSEVERQGIGFVRRATGGRAVLHDQELTYSIIVSEKAPGIPKTVNEAYRVLSMGLLHGFRLLQLDAEMVNLSSSDDKGKYAAASSAACFDSPSWYELVVEGRKIAGSAQTRQKGVVLQHGSILLDMDVDQLFSLLKFPSERVKERLMRSFNSKAVAINDIKSQIGQPPATMAELRTAFRRGYEEGMGLQLTPSELTPYEMELAEQLASEKYGSTEWNRKR